MKSSADILPTPWTKRGVVMTGGLFAVGFGADSDLALCVTHDGRGLIDCLTGQKPARDREQVYPDEGTFRIEGIGSLAGTIVTVAGVDGGELPKVTADGWRLDRVLSNSSQDVIRLLLPTSGAEAAIFTGFIPEVRAFGFSPTGRSFVIVTGADVFLYAR